MKVRYIGETFGIDSLTNGEIYSVIGEESGNLRIVDDSGEDYLYDANNPGPMDGEKQSGNFEIVEDDAKKTLGKSIRKKLKTA